MNIQISKEKMTQSEIIEKFKNLEDWQLSIQEIAEQAAINALSHLLNHGCTEEIAIKMLASLKIQASLLNEEIKNRSGEPLFNPQSTLFN